MTPDEIAALNDRMTALEAKFDKWSVVLLTAILGMAGLNLAVG